MIFLSIALRSADVEDERQPPLWVDTEDGYFYQEWLDFGFDPLEALGLLNAGLSPSEVREFMRHNPKCDVRTTVQILL